MLKFLLFFISMLMFVLMSACGKTGDLYLPEDEKPEVAEIEKNEGLQDSSEQVDSGDGFNFNNQNIQDSSGAGGSLEQ